LRNERLKIEKKFCNDGPQIQKTCNDGLKIQNNLCNAGLKIKNNGNYYPNIF